MTNKEAVNWIINITADIGKAEHRDLWHYEQALYEIREILEYAQPEPDIIACGDCKHWICHDKRCVYWNHGVKPLDWCCYGERRIDETD